MEWEARWPDLRAIARTAEQAGFDSVWFGDHLLYRYATRPARGPWETWSTLGALAEATERVAIGPLVASTAFHAPFMLAKHAATVDEISGGRLVLGLGAGWNDVEFAALGAPFDHRISRFEESFTIVRTLLADGSIDFDGQYVQARDAELLPRSTRPGGPLLLVGSSGPKMLAATDAWVDGWNAWYADTGNTPEGVAPLRGRSTTRPGRRPRSGRHRKDRRGARADAGWRRPDPDDTTTRGRRAADRGPPRRHRGRTPGLCTTPTSAASSSSSTRSPSSIPALAPMLEELDRG